MRPNLLCLAAVLLALPLAGCGSKNETAPEATQPAPQIPQPDPLTGAGMSREEVLRRLDVAIDLQWLALATENYHDNWDSYFPPADGAGSVNRKPAGKPDVRFLAGYSWRALVLEFMGPNNQAEADLQKALKLGTYPLAAGVKPGEEWDRPKLKEVRFDQFAGPRPAPEPWDTYYRAFVGNGAAFEPGRQLTKKDFTDGLDKTILIVEAGEAVPWPKPDELPYAPDKPLPRLGGTFADGFYAAFADGTVRFIKNGTDEKLLRALITRNGGEPIAELPPKVDLKALRKAAGHED
jgi:hypothetical protein